MGSLGWAVALSVLSAASYAAAAVAQERLAEHGQRGLARWAVALLLTGAGVSLHVVALNFGTVAVVQALGTLTLLFALPIAAVRFSTPIGRTAWADALLTVIGLALILSLSVESSEPVQLTEPADRRLSLITLAVVVVLSLAAWRAGPRVRSVLLAAAAGTAFGIASVLSKAVLASYTDGGFASMSPLALIAVLIFSTGGYLLSQLSYGRAGLAAPLATVSVSNPIVAAIAGVVVFDEGFRFGTAGLVVVAFAAVVMTLGVIGLARRAATQPSSTQSASTQSASIQSASIQSASIQSASIQSASTQSASGQASSSEPHDPAGQSGPRAAPDHERASTPPDQARLGDAREPVPDGKAGTPD